MSEPLTHKENEILAILRRHPGLTCTGLNRRLPMYPARLIAGITRGLCDRGHLIETLEPSERYGTVARRYTVAT